MKIHFFWSGESRDKEPGCHSDVISDDGLDVLACLFTDCGGRKYESSLGWLNEGLSRIGQVKSGVVECSDWSRDNWGVELKDGVARIYSLYDDGCSAAMAIDDFERSLLAWIDFIKENKRK